MRRATRWVMTLVPVMSVSGCAGISEMKATQLRCEYLTNPPGVGVRQPRLSWVLESDRRGDVQSAYQIMAASSEEKLRARNADLWDSGKIASDDSNQVVYRGTELASRTTAHWKVRVWDNTDKPTGWSGPAWFRMGLLEPSDWKADWIGKAELPPAEGRLPALPPAMLRKTFTVDRPIRQATVAVSALGVYELRINGRRVGDNILSPEWTNYRQRVQYQVYDVTGLLKRGDNAVGAILGDGWYTGKLGLCFKADSSGRTRGFYGSYPHLLMQMEIACADGSTRTIATDASWRSTTDGPIRKACLLDGEVYDARLEKFGWDQPGYNDHDWHAVHVQRGTAPALVAQPNEPIRVTQELKPVGMSEPAPGVYVFDFGQNLAGFCRVKAHGPAGAAVRLRHAEVLKPDGNLYRDNLRMSEANPYRGARQEDEFILRGEGAGKTDKVYEPHFTYHGFRYVELTGLAYRPSLDALVARAFHSTAPMTGGFECSNPMLNQLVRNIQWTQRNNMHGVPTDCPQRDERLGWMGDIQAFSQTACFNMDMAAFYTKWLQDVRDDQTDDGRYPDFAPHPYDANKLFSGAPAWADGGVFVPWCTYVNYGDTRILEAHFESARRWVDWIHANNPALLWKNQRSRDYGDWLNGDTLALPGFGFPKGVAAVPKEMFATAFFQQSALLVSRMARIIGKEKEAARYAKLADRIKSAYQVAYVKPDGKVEGNTQSGYALSLAFDLMPAELREAAARHMVKAIEDYQWHISTGIHTTVRLMRELTKAGRNDVAYRLIGNRTVPSWGYMIEHGGTTVWERWDGYIKDRGYRASGMNSFDHYAIGAVGEWMYRTILGINPDENQPGYKHVILRPEPGGGLTWARGHYDSIRGRIAIAWKLSDERLTLEASVPANTKATLFVPARNCSAVTESGRPTDQAPGVIFRRMEPGAAVYELGSGTYCFVSGGGKMAPP